MRAASTDRLIAVYTGERPYQLDRVEVMPVESFFDTLHRGGIF